MAKRTGTGVHGDDPPTTGLLIRYKGSTGETPQGADRSDLTCGHARGDGTLCGRAAVALRLVCASHLRRGDRRMSMDPAELIAVPAPLAGLCAYVRREGTRCGEAIALRWVCARHVEPGDLVVRAPFAMPCSAVVPRDGQPVRGFVRCGEIPAVAWTPWGTPVCAKHQKPEDVPMRSRP